MTSKAKRFPRETDPASQSTHAAEVVAPGNREYLPTLQPSHVEADQAPMAVEKDPAEQRTQAVAPANEAYLPIGHAEHDDPELAVVAREYVPFAHCLHCAAPTALEYLPAEHGVQVLAPAPAKVPAGHSWHASTDLAPTALELRPAGQGTHTPAVVAPVSLE